MIVKTYQAAAALAVAAEGRLSELVSLIGDTLDAANDGTASTVHALAVPAAQLAGPCDGMPELSADTLGWLFHPAGDADDPSAVKVIDAQTFTVDAPGGGTYTASLTDAGGATVTGPDAASVALLERHVNLCLGAVTTTPQDGPAVWTSDGRYSPMPEPDAPQTTALDG